MRAKIIKVMQYGEEVSCNEKMDELRGSESLCGMCVVPHCEIYKKIYNIRFDENIDCMITKCRNFKEEIQNC